MSMAMEYDPWRDRLMDEKKRLDAVNRSSDFVRARAASPSGSAPDRYIVTFQCKGIVGIDVYRYPVFSDTHEVEIYCDRDYPMKAPNLRWLTPIWHPNVQHVEPKNVCINKEDWLGNTGLDWLCELLFDMVQYRNYHAKHEKPFPLDLEVARWVIDFGEPKNIVNKWRRIYVDDKPFVRPGVSVPPRTPVPTQTPEPKLTLVSPPKKKVMFLNAPPSSPSQSPSRPLPAPEPDPLCVSCGSPLLRGSRVCSRCGAPTRRVKFL
jgi:ubiquitin-protein ligase